MKQKPPWEVDIIIKLNTATGMRTFSWLQRLFPCAFLFEGVFFAKIILLLLSFSKNSSWKIGGWKNNISVQLGWEDGVKSKELHFKQIFVKKGINKF